MTAARRVAGVPLLAVQPVPAGDRLRGGAGDPRRHRRPARGDRRRRRRSARSTRWRWSAATRDLFRAAICMSGTFDIEQFIGGFTDDLFFSSPMHFLPGLEGPELDALRQRFVVLASGSGRWEDIGESWRAAERARREGRAQPGRRLGPGVRPRLADLVADAPGVPGTARRDRRQARLPSSDLAQARRPARRVHDGAHAEACSAAADLVVELFAGARAWTTYAGCPPTTAATRSSGSRPVRRVRPRCCSTPTTTCSPPTRRPGPRPRGS